MDTEPPKNPSEQPQPSGNADHHIKIPPISSAPLPKMRTMEQSIKDATKKQAEEATIAGQSHIKTPEEKKPDEKPKMPPRKVGIYEEAMLKAAETHMAAFELKPEELKPEDWKQSVQESAPTTPSTPPTPFTPAPVPPDFDKPDIKQQAPITPVKPYVAPAPQPAPSQEPAPLTPESTPAFEATTQTSAPTPTKSYVRSLSPLPPATREFDFPVNVNMPHTHIHRAVSWTLFLALIAGGLYALYAFVLEPSAAFPRAFTTIDTAPRIHEQVLLSVDSPDDNLKDDIVTFNINRDRSESTPRLSLRLDVVAQPLAFAADLRSIRGTTYEEVTRVPDSEYKNFKSVLNNWYMLPDLSVVPYHDLSQSLSTIANQKVGDIIQHLQSSGVIASSTFRGFVIANGTVVRKYYFALNEEKAISVYREAVKTVLAENELSMPPQLLALSPDNVTGIGPLTAYTNMLTGELSSIRLPVEYTSGTSTSELLMNISFDSHGTEDPITVPKSPQTIDEATLNVL